MVNDFFFKFVLVWDIKSFDLFFGVGEMIFCGQVVFFDGSEFFFDGRG